MLAKLLFLIQAALSSGWNSDDSTSIHNVRISIPSTISKAASYQSSTGKWDQIGSSGVVCIHMALLPDNRLLCFERPHEAPYPQNSLSNGMLSSQIDLRATVNSDGTWSSKFTPITVTNNPFCAGHSLLADGGILVAGGDNKSIIDSKGQGSVVNGRQGMRIYRPCAPGSPASCLGTWEYLPDMTTQRWYPTVVTLEDGSAIIIGGQTKNIDFGGLKPTDQNPTYEYYPPKAGRWPRQLDILQWAFPHNLYAPAFVMPDGNIFMIVSNKTVIIDVKTEAITNLPDLVDPDHSPWVYPHSPTMVVLPMTIANNFAFQLMICGGSKLPRADGFKAASPTCYTIAPKDPNPQWIKAKDMPNARLMPDSVILPDGTVLFVNGASSGQAGGNQGQTQYASGPIYAADLYDPSTQSWTTLASASNKRLYHSVALLLETGHVVTAGSEFDNHDDFWEDKNTRCFENITFIDTNPKTGAGCTDPFNYNIERFTPPYLQVGGGPVLQKAPATANYGRLIQLDLENTTNVARVTFIRTASSTHSTNTDQRFIELVVEAYTEKSLFVRLPASAAVAPPGNWFVWALNQNSIPSAAKTIRLQKGTITDVAVPSTAKKGAPTAPNRNNASRNVVGSLMALLIVFAQL